VVVFDSDMSYTLEEHMAPDLDRSLPFPRIFLLQGPRGVRFLMSEVPLYRTSSVRVVECVRRIARVSRSTRFLDLSHSIWSRQYDETGRQIAVWCKFVDFWCENDLSTRMRQSYDPQKTMQ